MKRVKGLLMGAVGVGASVVSQIGVSQAALTFPTIDTADVTTIAAGMLGLLGAVWALKKAIGFLRA